MATEAKEKKPQLAELPKGCVRGVAPDGETPIVVRPVRGPGPWFRVKHPLFGHKLVKATNPDEAVQKFAAEHAPAECENKKWMEAFRPACRVGKLPEAAPATTA